MHAAARQHCLERYAYWCDRYSEIVGKGGDRAGYQSTAEALRTFPRYNVLNAIRIELKRMERTEFSDLEKTRSLFVMSGETVGDEFN